jgi:hypothetical protein
MTVKPLRLQRPSTPSRFKLQKTRVGMTIDPSSSTVGVSTLIESARSARENRVLMRTVAPM